MRTDGTCTLSLPYRRGIYESPPPFGLVPHVFVHCSSWEISTCLEVLHHLDWSQHGSEQPELSLAEDGQPLLSAEAQVGLVKRCVP